jgi:dihydroorotate dehydrogenase (fumarate)
VKADLSTTYLGLQLANPIVPSASPITGDIDHIHALVEAGAPAVVLPSLFEEQIDHDAMAIHNSLEQGAGAFPEATTGYLPELDDYNTGADLYLELVRRAKAETPIPVIGSLNGSSAGGWTRYAKVLEEHGLDALELNIYRIAASIDDTAHDVEAGYLRLVESVVDAVDIPIAVKVAPFFTAMGSMVRRFGEAGASGMVLFNRFFQPDIDLTTLAVSPNLELSNPYELRLALRWIAMLHGRVAVDIAATGGVHGGQEAVKGLLAGATVTQMASGLLRHGAAQLTTAIGDFEAWLTDNGYESSDQARGSLSQESVADPGVFERANYIKTLTSYTPSW